MKHAREELYKRRSAVGTDKDPYVELEVATVGEMLIGRRHNVQNRNVNFNWNRLQTLAEVEISATLAELPKPLREQAGKLAITFEQAPSDELQAVGIKLDTHGLFTGAEFADGEAILPPQIILFPLA